MSIRRQIEGNGFSDRQGKMIPKSNEKCPGNVGLAILESTFSVFTVLFIRQFGFLSKLPFREGGGWYESILFIIDCCVTSYPKTHGLKNSHFFLAYNSTGQEFG